MYPMALAANVPTCKFPACMSNLALSDTAGKFQWHEPSRALLRNVSKWPLGWTSQSSAIQFSEERCTVAAFQPDDTAA
jgi:hypothetical protein